MASTGDLRVVVTSDSSQFRTDMTQNAGAIRKFKQEASSSVGSMRALEFGRLAEDFSVGYQLQGMTGAFRASANNITQLATTISPLAGGIAGLSVAAIGIIPTLLNMGTVAEDDAKKFDKLTAAANQLAAANDRAGRAAQLGAETRRRVEDLRGADPVRIDAETKALAQRKEDLQRAGLFDKQRLLNSVPEGLQGLAHTFLANPGNASAETLLRAARTARTPLGDAKFAWGALSTDQQWLADLLGAERSGGLPVVSDQQFGRIEDTVAKMLEARNEQLAVERGLASLSNERARAEQSIVRDAEKRIQQAQAERRDAVHGELDRMRRETLTPGERLGGALDDVRRLQLAAEREGVALDGKITGRFQLGALRDFARATGALDQAGKLEGVTRGSREDFSARIGANSRDPATLLERQLQQMQRDGATQEQLLGAMKELVKQSGEPPVILEF